MIRNPKDKAKRLFFAGSSLKDICRQVGITRQRLLTYQESWMNEKVAYVEKMNEERISQMELIEFNLFKLIEEKAPEHIINEAQLHYLNFRI